jgi:hypothetical protein
VFFRRLRAARYENREPDTCTELELIDLDVAQCLFQSERPTARDASVSRFRAAA